LESSGNPPKAEEKVDELQIYTLGGLRVLRRGIPLIGLETRKVEALLVYLACNRRSHPREVLADLLWDERSQQQAQSNLRVALANLRKHLGDYITVDRDAAALNPGADVWLDMAELEKGLRNWQADKGLKSAQEVEQVEQAIELYQGDFLVGFTVRECRGFEDWTVRERERLHGLVVDSLHDLVAFDLENAAYQAGLAHATRLLEIDPLMEAAHCQRMALLARSGRRNEALAQYETLKRILWEELGIIPTETTEALLQMIRSGEMEQVKSVAQVIRGPEIGVTILPNPYKGLRPFTEADASDFFGREALTNCLLARLGEAGEASRFLAVVGPSGSGKSSVVKAGLIPALRRGALPGSENWHILEILPSAHPLEELEIGLLRIAGCGSLNLSEQLQRDERGVLRAVRLALPGEGSQLLLVIDQFEELFTLVQERATLKHFLNSLSTAILGPHTPLRVVITLRADYFDRPLSFPGLSNLMQQRTELVLPLTPQELERAIRLPAERLEMSFEPGLVTKIIAEVVDQPEALPLLQYSLTELFESRDGLLLTDQAYQAIGGVVGALSQRAEDLYDSLDQAGQEAARHLFLRLVALGEGAEETRRRVLRSELEAISKETQEDPSFAFGHSSLVMNAVIESFGKARLLSFNRDPITREPTIEVAHEALLREWVRLRTWLDESRQDLRQQGRLRLMAAEWDQAGRESSFLLRGSRLGQFEGWATGSSLPLTPTEKAYLQASLAERAMRQQRELIAAQRLAEAERQRAEEQARRVEEQTRLAGQLRRRALFLAGALLVAAVLAAIAVSFGQRAQMQSRLVISRELVAAAIDNLEIDQERSLLLAMYAAATVDTPAAEDALHRALLASRSLLTLHLPVGVADLAFNAEGTRLATAGSDGSVKVWDTATGQELFTQAGKTSWVNRVSLCPEGKQLAEIYFDGSVGVRDTSSLLQSFGSPGQANTSHSTIDLVFSPDGTRLAVAREDGTVSVQDTTTGQELLTLRGHTSSVEGVAFSPDGKRLATASHDGTIRVWDATSGEELLTLNGDQAQALVFSPDGTRLVTGHSDGGLKMWDASSGKELLTFDRQIQGISAVAFSPDGMHLATASGDNTVRVWDVSSGKSLFTLAGHTGKISNLAFSPDGFSLATASLDKSVRLWDISPAGSREVLTMAGLGGVSTAAFSLDGTHLVTSHADGTVKVWDTATGKELLALSGQTSEPLSAVFSSDGSRLATFSVNEAVRIWEVSTGKQLFTLPDFDQVYGAAFSPDGDRLAVAVPSQQVKILDLATARELFTLRDPLPDEKESLAFSPDGARLATSKDSSPIMMIWDVSTGDKLLTLLTWYFSGDLAFSPDWRFLATSNNVGVISVQDLNSGEFILELGIHPPQVNDLAFSPDGKRLATASIDGTVKIWDAISRRELLTLSSPTGLILRVAFSPDGRRLASLADDGTLRVYAIQIDDLLALARSRLTRSLTTEECQQYLHVDQCPPLP